MESGRDAQAAKESAALRSYIGIDVFSQQIEGSIAADPDDTARGTSRW